MAKLLGKAKKMKPEGRFRSSEFKQVLLDPAMVDGAPSSGGDRNHYAISF
jgi:hypothetical protein